ncbi:hypothetical protein KKD03_05665 [Patescibacteria group bacterium]|nr:hypothetical protein [Patescibacteria group bacterium]
MATALREIFARYVVEFDRKGALKKGARATDQAKRGLTDLSSITNRASGFMRAFGGVIAGAIGIGAMTAFARATMESTGELMRWSSRLNISIQQLRGWTAVSAQYGASVDDVTDALKELQLKAQDAITGGTSQAEMFQRIGISLDDLRPRVNDVAGLMDFFVEKLERVNDEGLRNFTVDELMSDAGTRMLPVFMQGSEALRRMRGEVEQESDSVAELARHQSRLNRTTSIAKRQLESAAATVLVRLIPATERVIKKVGDLASWFSDLTSRSHILETTIAVLGGTLAAVGVATSAAWIPVVLPVLVATAAFIALALVLDDVWVTLDGGKSVTRDFLDSWLGASDAAFAIGQMHAAITDLGNAMLWFWNEILGAGIIARPITDWLMEDLRESAPQLTEESRRQLELVQAARRRTREAAAGGEELTPQAARRARVSVDPRSEAERVRVLQETDVTPTGLATTRPLMWERSLARPGQTDVDARMEVSIVVNEVSDAQETGREIDRRVRSVLGERDRQLEAALVRAGGVGSGAGKPTL